MPEPDEGRLLHDSRREQDGSQELRELRAKVGELTMQASRRASDDLSVGPVCSGFDQLRHRISTMP